MKDNTLSERNIRLLMVNLLCNKLFILAPLYFKQTSGSSALIVTTLVFSFTILLWNIYCKYSSGTIIKMLHSNMGITFVIICITIISSLIIATTIQQYSAILKASILKTTPISFISGILIFITLTGNACSLKNLGIASAIFVPVIYTSAIILVLFSVTRDDIFNFFPLLDTTHTKLSTDVFLMMSMLYELIFLFFVPDTITNTAKIKKAGNLTIIWSYVCFTIISVIFSMTLPTVPLQNNEPFFRIIRMAHFGNITSNFDSVFLILYCISAYLYLSTMLALIFKTANNACNKTVSKTLKIISLIIIVVVSLNMLLGEYFFELFSRYYVILFIITFITPLILILSNKVQKCKTKN